MSELRCIWRAVRSADYIMTEAMRCQLKTLIARLLDEIQGGPIWPPHLSGLPYDISICTLLSALT